MAKLFTILNSLYASVHACTWAKLLASIILTIRRMQGMAQCTHYPMQCIIPWQRSVYPTELELLRSIHEMRASKMVAGFLE